MTNLEYIKTLDADKMAEMLLTGDCPYCIYRLDCRGDCDCKEGVLAWLKQEYIEPPKMVDSNEIIKGIERGIYCKSSYCKLAVYGNSCEGAECITAIKNYIKAMEGVKNETV